MGMIMHDDVPYGEGTSYTQGTGIAINNNVIAVDADNTPTENSEKPVKSKGVYEVVEQIYADNGVLGAKNLLKYPYDITAQTLNGMTLTANSDGVVTLNGTTTSLSEFLLLGTTSTMLKVADMPSKNLILKGSGSADYCNEVIYRDSNNVYISDQRAFNDDMELVIPSNAYYMRMAVLVKPNVTLSNAVLYPMLRLASDTDDTYVPYAMTNRELTELATVQESAVTDIVSGASVDVNTGNHLLKNGAVVNLILRVTNVTVAQFGVICKIPSGYRPRYNNILKLFGGQSIQIQPDGNVISLDAAGISSATLVIAHTWITN